MTALYNPVLRSFKTKFAWTAQPWCAVALSPARRGSAGPCCALPTARPAARWAPAPTAKNAAVKALGLNGQPLNRSYITYQASMAGGELRFEMAPAN